MKARNLLLYLTFALISDGLTEEANELDSATRRGLARVKQAASDWQTHKTCFSCHHQTLPMLAALEGERVGFPLDKDWMKSQADTTHAYFEERIDTMNSGDHVPGGAATTGFGFWALSLDERPSDPTTTSMVSYLLQIQGVSRLHNDNKDRLPKGKSGHWQA